MTEIQRLRCGFHAPKAATKTLDDWICDNELLAVKRQKEKQERERGLFEGQRLCTCPETLVNGIHMPLHRARDCAYAKARSSFVPLAVAVASGDSSDNDKGSWRCGNAWTR